MSQGFLLGTEFERQYKLSAEIRWLHWIRAMTIFALIVTGLYLAAPFLAVERSDEPVLFQNALFRFWHIALGLLLTCVTLFRVYLFFFDTISRTWEWKSFKDVVKPKSWWEQLKYYLMIGSFKKQGLYGPIQLMAYMFLMLMLVGEILTGFMLYTAGYHEGLAGFIGPFVEPLTALVGGLAPARNLHYIFMWGIIIFIPIHIYMVFWYANQTGDGSVDAMFSGYSFKRVNRGDRE